jgi:hypothetical protein
MSLCHRVDEAVDASGVDGAPALAWIGTVRAAFIGDDPAVRVPKILDHLISTNSGSARSNTWAVRGALHGAVLCLGLPSTAEEH